MKAITIIVVFIFSFLPNKGWSFSNSKDSVYICKIVKITKAKKRINDTNKAYIVLAQDTLSKLYFTIVTLKSKNKCNARIKEGDVKSLNLKKYFENNYVIQYGLKLSVVINGTLVNIPFDWYTYNIFTTRNFSGLCYIP